MGRLSILAALIAVAITGYAVGFYVQPAPTQVAGMRAAPAGAPAIPPVTGYSEGREILFLHTETSDPKIAKLLTDMMGSPVLHVPSLAQVPGESLARVYVYKNGPKPDGPRGPLGFQPDVFDNPPGQPGYRPLRRVLLVTWKDEKTARLHKSAAEVKEAMRRGEITVEDSGIVVNMPFLTWPGGRR